jgi:hypothetical protein
MWAFFSWLANAFAWVLTFFDKWRVLENAKTAFNLARFASRKVFIALLVALMLTYIALAIAFAYFTFTAVSSAYDFISQLLSKIQSGGGSGNVSQTFFYLLNVSGIVTGLNAAFPFIASALIYRLLKIVKTVYLETYDRFIKVVTDITKLITAS